ncbi:MAG: FAD binding domain-containing protein [Anaerolineae bacterium]
MAPWKYFLRPTHLQEALQMLSTAPRPVAPLAGGTDLLLDLQQGRHPPLQTLLDVTGIRELQALEVRGDRLFIGAAVPLNRITRDPQVGAHAQALVEAGNLIAGPQVRNVATLGGNVAHALPAADGTIALLALGAEAEVASLNTTRRLPLSELFQGPGKSALRQGEELLVGFYLPLQKKGQASCFKRIMRPQGVALPILNCAIWLTRHGERVEEIRIAVGPAAAIPFRARQAESALCGHPLSEETFTRSLQALLAEVQFRSSPQRASAEYRRHLIRLLYREVLYTAWRRAS